MEGQTNGGADKQTLDELIDKRMVGQKKLPIEQSSSIKKINTKNL